MNSFKFAHIADIHLDAWREKELKELNIISFEEAINKAIEENIDFLIISGDLFHTSHPSIETLTRTLRILKKLKEESIPVFTIPGSHDFSQTEQTFLSVLEEAEFITNVAKAKQENNKITLVPTTIDRLKVNIYGLIGRKLGLEKEYYENLNPLHPDKNKFNIFLFHSAISEYKPENLENMPSIPLNLFPKNMDYYAAGHVHQYIEIQEKNHNNIYYPGPLYPSNFKELEELKKGSYLIVNVRNKHIEVSRKFIEPKKVSAFNILINRLNPIQTEQKIINEVSKKDIKDKIVLLRIQGILSEGSVSDIDFRKIYHELEQKHPYTIKRNILKLESKEFEEFKTESDKNINELESEIIKEHLGQQKVPFNEENIIHSLISDLDTEKHEGETNESFKQRIILKLNKTFDISQK